MTNETNYNDVSVLIVGAGPAGLAAAITLKKNRPDLDVVVIDKAADPGNHNLSGAVLEPGAIAKLMDPIDPEWAEKRTVELRRERDSKRSNETSNLEAKLAAELDKHFMIPDALAQEFGTEYTLTIEPVTAPGLSQATASTIPGGEEHIDLSPTDWL